MRKVTAFFVSTFLIAALLMNSALPAFAAQSQKNLNSTYSITCDKSEVNVGDIYYFTLTGHNIEDMYAYDCRVTFDSSKADFVIDETYSTIRNAFFYPKLALDSDSEAALIFTLLGDATPISGDKMLCVFAFRAKEPGNANFAMKLIQIVDNDLNDITLTENHPTATIVQKAVAPPPPVVTSVSVSPAQAEILKGKTQAFSAVVNGENSPGQAVTWSVEGNSSTDTVIASDGVLSVADDEAAAILTVRATSVIDGTKSGTASVSVAEPVPTVTAVTVSPSTAEVQLGKTKSFTASVVGEYNPVQTVTWSVEGASSEDTAISVDGVLSVGIDETAKNLTVKATSTVDTAKSGEASVTVTVPPATVKSVTVTPNTASVQMGEAQEFSAVVNGEWNPAQTVTWSVEGNSSANTEISEDGILTIGFDETAKNLTVKATSTVDTAKSGEASVVVTVPPATVSSVTVTPNTASVQMGEAQEFSAVVNGEWNPAQTVTWSVEGASSEDTAISADGVLSVGIDETAKNLTVKATSTVDMTKSGTASVAVTVPPPVVSSVTVSPSTAEVQLGKTKSFTASVVGEYNPAQSVTWSVEGASSEDTVISADGVLSVGIDETAKTLTVKATSTVDTTKSGEASVAVTVPPPVVSSVTVSPNTASVQMGEEQKFSAVVNGEWNPAQTVTWSVEGASSEDTAISADGVLSVGIDETAKSLTVKATSTVDTTKSGTASVTVTVPPPVVSSVTVSPNTASVQMGETQKFSAVVNGEWNPAQTVTWSVEGASSEDTAISADGVLSVGIDETAKNLTVKATSTVDTTKSGAASVTVTVPPATVKSVTVAPNTASVQMGETQEFSAVVNGEWNPAQTVTWSVEGASSEDTAISADGVLSIGIDETAKNLTVKATSTVDTTKSGEASVTVTVPPATVSLVTVTPNTASVQMGEVQEFSAVVNGEWNPAQSVTWSVEGASSEDTAISADGVLSVGIDETAKSLTVKATSTVDTAKSGTASVTVTVPPATVKSVTVTPNTASVQMGETQKFSAVVNGEWNPAQTVTWSVEGNISANTAISEDGTLTIGFDETAKNLTVKATSTVDTTKSGEATVKIIVVDYAPQVEQKKVTLNPWLINGEAISFVETNGNKIIGAELLVPVSVDGETTYAVSDKLSLTRLDGTTSWVLNNLDAEQKATEIENQTIKAKLRVSTEKGVFELPLTVVIKNIKPYVVTSQAEKFNLFYTDSEATLDISSKTDKAPLSVSGAEFKSANENPVTVIGAAADFNKETGKLTIKYANPLNPSEAYVNGKPVVKGTLYVSVEGYNWQVSKTVTIGTVTSKPSYSFSPASGTINTVLGDSKSASFKLIDKATGEEIRLDENATAIAKLSPADFVILEQKDSEVTLTLNNIGTEEEPKYKGGTATIAVKQSNWLTPINYSYKLTAITSKPTAKLTNPTLQLNSVFSTVDAHAKTDVTLNQSGVTLKGTAQMLYTKNEAAAAALDVIYENGVISASFKDGYDHDTAPLKNGTYKFEYTPIVESSAPEGVTLKTVNVSVKITDATPAVSAGSVTVNRAVYKSTGKTALSFVDSDDITVIAAANGAQSSLLFSAQQTLVSAETSRAKLAEAGKISVTYANGEIVAKINDSSVKEGSYKYTLPLRWNNGSEDVNEKGSVTVTVKVENKETNPKPQIPQINKKRIQIIFNVLYYISRWLFG